MVGIYQIVNIISDKRYIGKSNNIERRFWQHRNELNKGTHGNKHLQRAWTKYGENQFIFTVLEECLESELNEKEMYWITKFGGCKSSKLYNNTPGGDGGAFFGEANGMYGKTHSDEVKEHLRVINKLRNSGKNNPMYGKHHSDEAKAKISKANSGRVRSVEARQKTSKTLKEGYSSGRITSHRETKYSAEFISELRAKKMSGMTYKQLSNEYGIGYGSMQNLIKHGRNSENEKSTNWYGEEIQL